MNNETVVIGKQRILKSTHELIKKEAAKQLINQNVLIRKILYEWELKTKKKK